MLDLNHPQTKFAIAGGDVARHVFISFTWQRLLKLTFSFSKIATFFVPFGDELYRSRKGKCRLVTAKLREIG
jgi:hypothetical protein